MLRGDGGGGGGGDSTNKTKLFLSLLIPITKTFFC
jgi:hypothetical protein